MDDIPPPPDPNVLFATAAQGPPGDAVGPQGQHGHVAGSPPGDAQGPPLQGQHGDGAGSRPGDAQGPPLQGQHGDAAGSRPGDAQGPPLEGQHGDAAGSRPDAVPAKATGQVVIPGAVQVPQFKAPPPLKSAPKPKQHAYTI